jgi:hypothetical protein
MHDKFIASDNSDLIKSRISLLRHKEVYYFGIGAAYEYYKPLFDAVRPQAALVSMIPACGLPDQIDGIPVRFADDVLAGNNVVLPIVIFGRKKHAYAMLHFLALNHPAWLGENVLACLL